MTTFFNMLAGAGTILELFPEAPEQDEQMMKSDAEQLAEDWISVGDDLRQAISQEALKYGEQTQEK